jgi:hypothetical protein
VKTNRKAARSEADRPEQKPESDDGRVLVTSRGLAAALGVSLRTVERMLRDGEIQPVWVREALRFHVPDAVQQLVAGAAARKNGRKAALAATRIPDTQYPRRAE